MNASHTTHIDPKTIPTVDPTQSEGQNDIWNGFSGALDDLNKTKEDALYVGLSGGSSLDSFYALIKERFGELSHNIRQRVRFVLLDERIVAVDHNDRNEKQLREKFLTSLIEQGLIKDEQIISVNIKDSDLGKEPPYNVDDYHHIAEDYANRVPRIDIGLFGVGPDGHIASLFPYHSLLQELEKRFGIISDSPKPPLLRLTILRKIIEEMPYAFLAIMKGNDPILIPKKKEIYEKLFEAKALSTDYPFKLLLELVRGQVVVMSDIQLKEEGDQA